MPGVVGGIVHDVDVREPSYPDDQRTQQDGQSGLDDTACPLGQRTTGLAADTGNVAAMSALLGNLE